MRATTHFVLLITSWTTASAAPLFNFTDCGNDGLQLCRSLFPGAPAPSPATAIQNGRLIWNGHDLGPAWQPGAQSGYIATVIRGSFIGGGFSDIDGDFEAVLWHIPNTTPIPLGVFGTGNFPSDMNSLGDLIGPSSFTEPYFTVGHVGFHFDFSFISTT